MENELSKAWWKSPAIEASDDSERRKRLTPDIRNAIVRDVVSTMHAFKSLPNKDFCTQVAKQLVNKYTFMKDVGTNVTGYVSSMHYSVTALAYVQYSLHRALEEVNIVSVYYVCTLFTVWWKTESLVSNPTWHDVILYKSMERVRVEVERGWRGSWAWVTRKVSEVLNALVQNRRKTLLLGFQATVEQSFKVSRGIEYQAFHFSVCKLEKLEGAWGPGYKVWHL